MFVRDEAVFELHGVEEDLRFQDALLVLLAQHGGCCPVDEVTLTLLNLQRLTLK